jgi:hypothetical protein
MHRDFCKFWLLLLSGRVKSVMSATSQLDVVLARRNKVL